MSKKNLVIVFVKAAVPGQVKTRLSPHLTSHQIVQLYRCFVLDTLHNVSRLATDSHRLIAYQPHQLLMDLRWLSEDVPDFFIQQGDNLGEKLTHAFQVGFERGFSRIVVVGTDSPHLSADSLDQAFSLLSRYDVVLGPAEDGGYYCVGLSHPCPEIFQNIMWSTEHVFQQTLNQAHKTQKKLTQIPLSYDIDTIHDLKRLSSDLTQTPQLAMHTFRYLSSVSSF